MKFTQAEIEALQEDPIALRALANWHDTQSTMAGPMGFDECVKQHDERVKAIIEYADALERWYDSGGDGEKPVFANDLPVATEIDSQELRRIVGECVVEAADEAGLACPSGLQELLIESVVGVIHDHRAAANNESDVEDRVIVEGVGDVTLSARLHSEGWIAAANGVNVTDCPSTYRDGSPERNLWMLGHLHYCENADDTKPVDGGP